MADSAAAARTGLRPVENTNVRARFQSQPQIRAAGDEGITGAERLAKRSDHGFRSSRAGSA
jgi:hypothetical protein